MLLFRAFVYILEAFTLWVVAICTFVALLTVAIKKEDQRQRAVHEYNCAHYGEAMNAHYDKDICPGRGNYQ